MDKQRERKADLILGIVVGTLVLALGLTVFLNNPFRKLQGSSVKQAAPKSSGWDLSWLPRRGGSDQRPTSPVSDEGEEPTQDNSDWPDGPVVRVLGDTRFEFVFVPAGSFQMGSESGPSDQRPVHPVRILRKFHLGRTKVSVAQFRAFVEATGYVTDAEQLRWAGDALRGPPESPGRYRNWRSPGFSQEADEPVVCISRRDALAFTRWLSEQLQEPIRLPTEAEWEYAATRQGGAHTGSEPSSAPRTAASRTQPPPPGSPERPSDMGTNALEWCLDVYHASYDGAPSESRPWLTEVWLPAPAARHVLRGASWADTGAAPDLHRRHARLPTQASNTIGFRIVRSPLEWGDEVETVRDWNTAPSLPATDPPPALPVLEIPLRTLPAGSFEMGSAAVGPSAQPVRKVKIRPGLAMGATEVTVGQFRRFVEATGYETDAERLGGGFVLDRDGAWIPRPGVFWREPGFPQTDEHPAVLISWWDAMQFCQWAGGVSGVTVRLPTEAEWEYACRAGGREDKLPGVLEQSAWYLGNSNHQSRPAGTLAPNAWGIFDLRGNAWEWCLDSWHPDYRGAAPDGRARFTGPWFDPVLRGGAFASPRWFLQASRREHAEYPTRITQTQGFRLVAEF
jgi:formylglycine-generating enzyme required for sulfatase activity